MKKRLSFYCLLLVLLFSLIHAQPDLPLPPSPPTLEPEGNATFATLMNILPPFFKKASILLGGIFGVYFILLIVRIYFEQKNLRVLKDIRYNLDRLNEHYNLSHSHHRKGRFTTLKEFFFSK